MTRSEQLDAGSVAMTPSDSLAKATALMQQSGFNVLPVLADDQTLLGVVHESRLGEAKLSGLAPATINDLIDRTPLTITDTTAPDAIPDLLRKSIAKHAPIIDANGRFKRMVSLEGTLISNCIPSLEGNELLYTTNAVSDGWLAVGPYLEKFERAIAEFIGVRHGIALVNGTAALHLALVINGVRPGDLVLTPTFTFAATANAIFHCGAQPVFFDVEQTAWGICPQQLTEFLETKCQPRDGELYETQTGARIGAIVPVHLYGHPSDMDPLIELAERFEIPLVEDGTEALGATYKERMVGNLHRICVLSFNGNKIITTGGGGMILTNDDHIANLARNLSAQAKTGTAEFVHSAIGYNYRMPNLNAAVGLAQAENLTEFIARKRRFVDHYVDKLDGANGVSIWQEADWARSSYWMPILTMDGTRKKHRVDQLRSFLISRGIEARPVWAPLHAQTPYQECLNMPVRIANRLHQSSLCLPCSVSMTEDELCYVADSINAYFSLSD